MRLHWPGLQRLRVKRQRVQVQAVSRRTARIRGVPLPHTLQIAAASRPPPHTHTHPHVSRVQLAAGCGLSRADLGHGQRHLHLEDVEHTFAPHRDGDVARVGLVDVAHDDRADFLLTALDRAWLGAVMKTTLDRHTPAASRGPQSGRLAGCPSAAAARAAGAHAPPAQKEVAILEWVHNLCGGMGVRGARLSRRSHRLRVVGPLHGCRLGKGQRSRRTRRRGVSSLRGCRGNWRRPRRLDARPHHGRPHDRHSLTALRGRQVLEQAAKRLLRLRAGGRAGASRGEGGPRPAR